MYVDIQGSQHIRVLYMGRKTGRRQENVTVIVYYCPLIHSSIPQCLQGPKLSFLPSSSLTIPRIHGDGLSDKLTSRLFTRHRCSRSCLGHGDKHRRLISSGKFSHQNLPSLSNWVYFSNLVRHRPEEPASDSQDMLTPLCPLLLPTAGSLSPLRCRARPSCSPESPPAATPMVPTTYPRPPLPLLLSHSH